MGGVFSFETADALRLALDDCPPTMIDWNPVSREGRALLSHFGVPLWIFGDRSKIDFVWGHSGGTGSVVPLWIFGTGQKSISFKGLVCRPFRMSAFSCNGN